MSTTRSSEVRKTISEKGKATRKRHSQMYAKTIKVKIDRYNPPEVFNKLQRIFLEGKWFFNYIHNKDIFNDKNLYKIEEVTVKKGCNFVKRNLEIISSTPKNEIVFEEQANIRSLSTNKKNGKHIGAIGFKKECNSLTYRQYNKGFKVIDKNHISLQLIGKLKVNGLDQILSKENQDFDKSLSKLIENNDIPSCKLIQDKYGDYYVAITLFVEKTKRNNNIASIDFGVGDDTLCIYDGNKENIGLKIKFSISKEQKIKEFQKELSKKDKGSKNYIKTKKRLNKLYIKNTRKLDYIHYTIIDILRDYYDCFYIQDKGNIKNWQKWFGKQIEQISIGKFITKLCMKSEVIEVNRWLPTTKKCPICNEIQDVKLSEKIITCKNRHTIDRNLRGAMNIYYEGLSSRDVKFRTEACGNETSTIQKFYEICNRLNRIDEVYASIVNEPGKIVSETEKCADVYKPVNGFSICTLSTNKIVGDIPLLQ